MGTDSTVRFTTRVQDYVRYRPGYPSAVIELLKHECGLKPGSDVADIGSGTGILTKLLLESGATTFAVEPNAAMRQAAEDDLRAFAEFRSLDATAEATTLPDHSVDLAVAAQAFHWFDVPKAREEFRRILRSPGYAALIWNDRAETGDAFLEGYEAILREYATDYFEVRRQAITDEKFELFFGHGMKKASFPNSQTFDYEGVVGRLMSSSYAPQQGDPRHEPMLAALRKLFDATSQNGTVDFLYETQVFYGQLN